MRTIVLMSGLVLGTAVAARIRRTANRQVFMHFFGMEITWK